MCLSACHGHILPGGLFADRPRVPIAEQVACRGPLVFRRRHFARSRAGGKHFPSLPSSYDGCGVLCLVADGATSLPPPGGSCLAVSKNPAEPHALPGVACPLPENGCCVTAPHMRREVTRRRRLRAVSIANEPGPIWRLWLTLCNQGRRSDLTAA